MNQHYGAAQALLNLTAVPGDSLEGVIVLQEAQTQATLALAHAQHTANLIAAREFINVPDSEIAERLDRPEPPKPAPVEHYRVGPARCNCGYDAYKISGIMIDYFEEFSMHLARNR